MSASEKLRALEQYREWSYPTDRNGNHVDDQVLAVLPQICALVEDAEVTIQTIGPMGVHLEALQESLAALDEALGEQA